MIHQAFVHTSNSTQANAPVSSVEQLTRICIMQYWDCSQENRCLLVCFDICVSMRVLYVLNAQILYLAKENIISYNSEELVQ